MSDREVYRQLLARIFAAGIRIRECGVGHICYVPAEDEYPPQIDIRRIPGGKWHIPGIENVEALVAGAQDLIEEICIVAHEFGHHGSRYQHYEDMMKRRNRGKDLITREEADAIRAEERRAWVAGEETLRQLGFREWQRFREISERMLKTYDDV